MKKLKKVKFNECVELDGKYTTAPLNDITFDGTFVILSNRIYVPLSNVIYMEFQDGDNTSDGGGDSGRVAEPKAKTSKLVSKRS